jgi:hypothetical protein
VLDRLLERDGLSGAQAEQPADGVADCSGRGLATRDVHHFAGRSPLDHQRVRLAQVVDVHVRPGVAAAIGVHRSLILRGKGNEATEDRSLAVAVDERGSYHDAAGIDYLELEGTSPSHRWRCRRLVIVASRTDAVADDTESACIDETPAGGCRRAEHRRGGALLHGHRGVETIVRVASKCGVEHHIGHRDPPLQPSAIGEVAGERLDALLA